MKHNLLLHNYDWNQYLNKYKDLERNCINNESKALEHYINLGIKEKRKIFHKKSFQFVNEIVDEDLFNNYNWQDYINNYNDLKKNKIITDYDGYYHYVKYGKKENRLIFFNLIEKETKIINTKIIDNGKINSLINQYLSNINKINIHIDTSNILNLNMIISNLKLKSVPYSISNFIISSKFPWGYFSTHGIQEIINTYININKKIIVFLVSDCFDKLNIPKNMLLFRTSLYKSKREYNEHILPYVWEKINKPFFILKKTTKPIISFCGQVDGHRKNFIDILQKNNNLICNFILRRDFWGGKPNDPNLIEEFSNNILTSHFVMCNRGRGNFSMRFYQTLSAGRIPILVDTDMLFPFENEIDWDTIIIRGKNEEEVIKKLLYWWNNKNIEEIQEKCKYIYDNYIDQKIYFNRILNDIYLKKIKI